MGVGATMVALGTVQGIAQISEGYSSKAEAKYNASILESKAKMVDIQKDIEFAQYERLKGQYMSKSVANVAGAGLEMGGSSMAVMLESQRQINLDQAIGQFNLQQEKSMLLSQAKQIKRAGKRAVKQGFTNALTTGIKSFTDYKMYTG
jgi:hypothetical protein